MENQKPSGSSDEIDLGQLWSRIGDFFRNIGHGTMRFIAVLRKVPLQNKTSFIGIISASIIIGGLYSYFLRKNYYESSMILSSDYFNKRLVESTIDKLNLLADEPGKMGLSKTLSMPDALANNILEFEAKPFVSETDLIELEVLKEQLKNAQINNKNDKVIDQVIQRIETENRHAFEITVRTLNPTVVGDLQISLVNYFRNNAYIKNRIEISKINLLERKQKLIGELQKLDSLKFVIYDNYKNMAVQGRQGSNNVILSDKSVTNPVEIYAQDLGLYDQLQGVNRSLYLQSDFEVVEGFTEFSEPASASLPRMLFYAAIVGIIIAYLDVALRQFNKYLANLT